MCAVIYLEHISGIYRQNDVFWYRIRCRGCSPIPSALWLHSDVHVVIEEKLCALRFWLIRLLLHWVNVVSIKERPILVP